MPSLRVARAHRENHLLYTAVFVVVATVVVAPLLFLIVDSFQIAAPGAYPFWGFGAWRAALGNSDIWLAMWNSVRLYLATSVIAWPVAIVLAWVVARTDIPGQNWIEFLLWLSFFLPSLTVVMGWVTLIDPSTGLFNQAIRRLPFINLASGPFDIYSFWGLVWVHLGQNAISIKTILLIPAFRNLDVYMEEAAQVSGAGLVTTLRRVVIPLMMPAIIVTALLSFVRLWQSFEIELVLGIPQGFYVYGTKIYDLLNVQVPEYGQATVLAVLVIFVTFPFMVFQQRFSVGRRYETITGRARRRPTSLARAKWPVFAAVMGIALIVSILPMVAVLVATFMKVFGHFELSEPWTLNHWTQVLRDPILLQAVRNTIVIAGSAALLSVAVSVVVAYILARTRYRLRGVLDVMTWLPQALPGMLMGLGVLWIVLTLFKPLYGTLSLLVIVTVVAGMTVGIQIVKSNMVQLGTELEEAARIAGASWFATLLKVVLPPLVPVLVLVATFSFVAASRDVSNIILLASGQSMTLALLQLDYMVAPLWESATVVALIMTLITTGVALVARACNLRLGVR
ncbi:MAG TPA: iron ABC transporter permease [Stellaceae bacterium]|nr:iron ABC transporter permease [Stellaceae bacterium]